MEDYGFLGKAMRAIGKHRERIGAKAVKQEMAEAKKDNAKNVADKRQKRIDDDIRERRRKRREDS